MEAFHFGIPVVAYAATAIPATLDGGGILHTERDPVVVAALVDRVLSDPALEAQVVASQDAALARLLARDFAGLVRGFVQRVLAGPPVPAPPVPFDFWDQFTFGEQLEALHQSRPAAYAALPRRPAASGGAD
jgi:hypothetical protein